MYGALFIPDFPLRAALRRHPQAPARPVAVLDAAGTLPIPSSGERGKARILTRNESAARLGVACGATATQGLARCPGLVLLNRCPEEERALQDALLDCAERLVPDFEDTGAGIVVLDLLGYPGGARAFGEDALRRMRTLTGGMEDGRAGAAKTPELAWLAARLTSTEHPFRDLASGEDGATAATVAGFLAPLPIAVLEPNAREWRDELASVLEGWGVRTLGELAALPREAVVERLGAGAGRLHELASGAGRRRLLRLMRAPQDYARRIEPEYGIETLDPLLFLVRRLLESLTARLAAAWLVAAEMRIELGFADGTCWREALRVPDPSGDVDLLFRVVHTRLENFRAPSPVVALGLALEPARPGKRQLHLFDSSLRDPNRFAETLARLEALAGAGRVGTPELLDTHQPDAFILRPFREEIADGATEGARKSDAARRPTTGSDPMGVRIGPPLRRFRPPMEARVRCVGGVTAAPEAVHSAFVRGRIRELRGPWLYSGDWWEPSTSWSRLEWDALLEDGTLCRLAHSRETWTVEGIYG